MLTVSNNKHKPCRGCIWESDCQSDERCWAFDDGNIYPIIKSEYEQALRERVEVYEEIIQEMED